MKGGTYAEALKAGFSEEHAGFLGRFGAEIRQEAVEAVFEKLEEQRQAKTKEWKARREFLMQLALCGIGGFFLGISIKFVSLHF